jgi:hypothetical protein
MGKDGHCHAAVTSPQWKSPGTQWIRLQVGQGLVQPSRKKRKSLSSIGIWTPNCPALSKSLYWLHCSGPHNKQIINKKYISVITTLALCILTFQSLMQYWHIPPQPTNLPHCHQLATVGLLVYERQHHWGLRHSKMWNKRTNAGGYVVVWYITLNGITYVPIF